MDDLKKRNVQKRLDVLGNFSNKRCNEIVQLPFQINMSFSFLHSRLRHYNDYLQICSRSTILRCSVSFSLSTVD